MTRGKQQKRTRLGLMMGIICTMIGVAWMPGLTGASPALLPPIGTQTPYPTGQASPVPTATSASTATPIPTLQPEATDTYIALQTPAGWAGKWTVVQWQDGLGSWHDVEGWVGAINNENQVFWTVQAAERGTGPYRWLVYTAAEGDLIATSDPFYATWPLGNIAWVQVPASATAAPGPEAGMRMRVRPPEGEWLWLASAPDEGRTVAWLKAGRVVTIIGGPETDADGHSWLQVRTESGWIGWCRESVDGAATLAPMGLEVGMEATVHTGSEIPLRLRSGAGVLNQIVAAMADGDRVTLIDGPVEDQSGLWWWQVRTGEGEIGWCVDYVEGLQTLIP